MPLRKIPKHLQKYTVDQHYDQYTPINHAVWRYVMRQNHHFLKDTAYEAYIDGLKASGISIEKLPNVEEMNRCLEPYGWGAVTIDGFIPGIAFFDFQSNGILPIAAEIRKLDNILYTPAPDIIHEAAGHAPILCDQTYSHYVKLFGEIGKKAIATKEEHDLFDAVRHYSNILEKGESTEEEIVLAKEKMDSIAAAISGVSEAEQISRLYWWTVEYGLIGDVNDPKIYGSGLLSSLSEGGNVHSDEVQKTPYNIETMINTGFDITKPQPQLFVCQNFEQLIEGVKQFSKTMAFMKGGTESLEKAQQSANVATIQYSSGVQVTGVLTELLYNNSNEAIYIKTVGPTALAYKDKQIEGHGTLTHNEGFGSPIGKLAGISTPIELMTAEQLKEVGLVVGHTCELTFESGIQVKGIVTVIIENDEKIQVISIENCLVTYNGEVLFQTEWGTYDMAIGEIIPSVFGGAADGEAYYEEEEIITEAVVESPLSHLDTLYLQIRQVREEQQGKSLEVVQHVVNQLDQYPNDWLLRLEIVELLEKNNWLVEINEQLKTDLGKLQSHSQEFHNLIERGLKII